MVGLLKEAFNLHGLGERVLLGMIRAVPRLSIRVLVLVVSSARR
jgi:hypothetical protein